MSHFILDFGYLIEVANRAVDMDSRARLLCYPRGSFYPLSPVPPMWYRGITKTYFRTLGHHSMPHQIPTGIWARPVGLAVKLA